MSTPSPTLPNFLVIGAYKSGTTSIHHCLRQHPQVYLPQVKEPNFFAFDEGVTTSPSVRATDLTTMSEYRRLFEGVRDEVAVGEVSPRYLTTPEAPARIHTHLPDVRLIAILRNPVERAYGEFLYWRRNGDEPYADFGRALDEQEDRYRRGQLRTAFYVQSGFYGEQLARYFDLFPSTSISVHLFEDLVRDPGAVMGEIFRFLGVDALNVPSLEQHNVSGDPRNALVALALRSRRWWLMPVLNTSLGQRARPQIERLAQRGHLLRRPALPPDQRARLQELYREDILALASLIGRDLSHWLK
jgi:hypothetical protein